MNATCVKKEWRLRSPFFLFYVFCFWFFASSAYAGVEKEPTEPVWSPYSWLLIEGHSDSFPLADIWHGLESNYQPGGIHLAIGRVEIGVRHGLSTVGLLSRYETHIKTSRDATELIWLSETDKAIPANRDWNLKLKIQQVRMHGINFSQAFTWENDWQLTLGLQLLQASEMRDGIFMGQIATHNNDYEGQANLHYFYTHDSIWKRPTNTRRGQGAALDVGLAWQVNDNHALQLTLLDALNGIYWKDMYYTDAKLISNRISYDANGQMSVGAAMTGFEGNKNYWQKLPVKTFLTWQGDIAKAKSKSQKFSTQLVWIDHYRDLRLNWFLAPTLPLPGVYASATSHRAFGIGYISKNLHTSFLINKELDDSRTATLSFSWGSPFQLLQ